jgi:hypothetical protein
VKGRPFINGRWLCDAGTRSAVFVVDPGHIAQYGRRSEEITDEAALVSFKRAAGCHGDKCELPDENTN